MSMTGTEDGSSLQSFGTTADGRAVEMARLHWPDGLQVEVLSYGAIVHAIRFPAADGGSRNALLSYDTLAGYEADTAYIGAGVGRVANRIAGGRFPLDGREVQVSVNEPPNTLHGGHVGFNKRLWRFDPAAATARSARLLYRSPDGEEGFPGAVEVATTFTLLAADTLEIAYEARAEIDTPVSLTHHLYFNLLGAGTTIDGHRLQVCGDAVTPVGAGMIPTGEVRPVDATPLDLRQPKTISDALEDGRNDPQFALAGGIDFNWTELERDGPVLRLEAPDGASLEVSTDQLGLQVYTGHKLKPPFARYAGLAVEPQGFPDAVNHPGFPSVMLKAGETGRWSSRYRLRA